MCRLPESTLFLLRRHFFFITFLDVQPNITNKGALLLLPLLLRFEYAVVENVCVPLLVGNQAYAGLQLSTSVLKITMTVMNILKGLANVLSTMW